MFRRESWVNFQVWQAPQLLGAVMIGLAFLTMRKLDFDGMID